MANTNLPVVGAAMPIALLADYRDWLIEAQRDLEIQDPFQPDLLDGDWRPLVRNARDVLDGYQGRLGIHGPFDGLNIGSRDPKVRSMVAERFEQALALGAELGASHMVIHSPFLFFGSPFVAHGIGTSQHDQINYVHQTLAEVLPLAEQAQCTLVIENIVDTNPLPLLNLVRSFDSQFVRMSLDTGHALLTNRIGGPPPDQWVREAGPLLGHLHLQDNDGNHDRHWVPGDGQINWYALFEALGELQHQPRMIIEIHNQGEIGRAATWLAQHGFTR